MKVTITYFALSVSLFTSMPVVAAAECDASKPTRSTCAEALFDVVALDGMQRTCGLIDGRYVGVSTAPDGDTLVTTVQTRAHYRKQLRNKSLPPRERSALRRGWQRTSRWEKACRCDDRKGTDDSLTSSPDADSLSCKLLALGEGSSTATVAATVVRVKNPPRFYHCVIHCVEKLCTYRQDPDLGPTDFQCGFRFHTGYGFGPSRSSARSVATNDCGGETPEILLIMAPNCWPD